MNIISRFRMDGDLKDETGLNHGTGHNIEFVRGVDGNGKGAAYLNGKDSYIEIPDSESLHFGNDDFFMGLWVKLPEKSMSFGDLICKFDDDSRNGFNLTINGTSGGYVGISDTRNVYFGIDNRTEGIWKDCGKPSETNTLISTMCVYSGDLYVGIADAINEKEACHVFRYSGNGQWTDCGRLGSDPESHTAYAMIVHNGKLYASTGFWNWDKAKAGECAIARVYCYEGGTDWRDCGQVGMGHRIMAMVSHQGELYAGVDSSDVYRYLGGKSWEFCGGNRGSLSKESSDIFRLDSFISNGDKLYAGGKRRVFIYKGGTEWECIASTPFDVTQIHKLQMYKGMLFVGSWPHGRVLKFDYDLKNIVNTGDLGIPTDKYTINEVNDLVCYNGKFYAGVIPKSEVYRYDGDLNWCKMTSLLENPEYDPTDYFTWNRVPSMAVYNGKLFASASSCTGSASLTPHKNAGRIFTFECGANVSHDNDIGTGWHHVSVSKEGKLLKIYIDGKETDCSCEFDPAKFNLDNNKPLTIGFGCLNYLNAAIDDVVIAKGKVDPEMVSKLYNRMI